MKKPLAILLLLFSFVSAQDIESLTAEQKKEYNRRKITVELQSTQGGAIVGNAFFSNQRDIWKAYRGLSQINLEEFYQTTGYEEEEKRLRMKIDKNRNYHILSLVCLFGGAAIASIEETKMVPWEYFEGYRETTVNPYEVHGGIIIVGSFYFMLKSLSVIEPPPPYETAVSIADDYNRELLNEIISR